MIERLDRNTLTRNLLGVQSLLFVLQVCTAFLQNQPAIRLESWSPASLPYSTLRNNPLATLHMPHFPRPENLVLSATGGTLNDVGGDSENDDEEGDFIEVESLTASQVTELIELSFFQACYALSKGDVEPLKLFIVAVVTATKKHQGASAKALALTVDSLPPSMRPLEAQERDLRETWIKAVYLMMAHVLEGFETNETDEVAKTYGPILVDLVAIHRTGMGLNVNQFVASRRDVLLPKRNPLILEDGPEDEDLVQLSVVTQTINVLFTTLVVLDEEYESTGPSAGDEEEIIEVTPEPEPEPEAAPAKKNKKKGKNTGSSGGRGFG